MGVSLPFRDRVDAARQLAAALAPYRGTHPLVLAIPRGAVPIGRIVADALEGELDVVLVRKLGAPGNPELAVGAVDEQGQVMVSEHAAWSGATAGYLQREAARQLELIRERRARYRPGQPPAAVAGRTVIVLDDGLATGATMLAALRSIRARHPARLVCAVPVAAADSLAEAAAQADEVVCLAQPRPFVAVGQHYRDFAQVGDAEVVALLQQPGAGPEPVVSRQDVVIPAGEVVLEGDLATPAAARGLVIFAHGSGSSRHSTRNRRVADTLNARGYATLLFDLLTAGEDRDPMRRFEIALLARRLDAAVSWVQRASNAATLPIGLFGASTGAAAALEVAAARGDAIGAVVSRGGRPDLAAAGALASLRVPTLLIVGGHDLEVLQLNRQAQAAIGVAASLAVIPGATHLFEEPGALDRAAALSADWFDRWL